MVCELLVVEDSVHWGLLTSAGIRSRESFVIL